MGRKRWMRKNKRDGTDYKPRHNDDHNTDPTTSLLSLHPSESLIAVAVGRHLRVLNYCTGERIPIGGSEAPAQAMALRILTFSPTGNYLLTGGDDKKVRLWDIPSGNCRISWLVPKKVTSCSFTADGSVVLFADKFGDVLAARVPTADITSNETAAAPQPANGVDNMQPGVVLGHFSTIITSIALSADSRWIATSDKEHRIKVSALPQDATQICVEIVSYCLGHLSYVSSCAFAAQPGGHELLVSGSGDGTVRVWDPLTGRLKDTFVAVEHTAAGAAAAKDLASEGDEEVEEEVEEGAEARGDAEEDDGSDDNKEPAEGASTAACEGGGNDEDRAGERRDTCSGPAVLCVATSRDGRYVAAVVEGDHNVRMLALDPDTHALSLMQDVSVPSVTCPVTGAFDGAGRLWVVGGPPRADTHTVHVAVVALRGGVWVDMTSEVCGRDALEAVESRSTEEEDEGGEEAAGVSGTNPQAHLKRKAAYHNVAARKAGRNDRKEAARLSTLAAALQ